VRPSFITARALNFESTAELRPPAGIKAEYCNGVLALFIPRAEADKPRSIKVN